ncbi:MAG: hypothetical protein DI586_01395 [Micavibrio aeruginosavorus]|uniref:Uncharacterized protein n=1 Tax=Micavibrio aeruginosavorus TaxID=349221 RepID=A0A2W5FQ36_9BACT|nr:MAG: hypothetical protein DI586_01395 [Micavibrio aeruginosavorus]
MANWFNFLLHSIFYRLYCFIKLIKEKFAYEFVHIWLHIKWLTWINCFWSIKQNRIFLFLHFLWNIQRIFECKNISSRFK